MDKELIYYILPGVLKLYQRLNQFTIEEQQQQNYLHRTPHFSYNRNKIYQQDSFPSVGIQLNLIYTLKDVVDEISIIGVLPDYDLELHYSSNEKKNSYRSNNKRGE